ncbi:MAG TPA: hypothetical protein VF326_11615, partial [Anaerolineaceae bacterium]
ALRPNVILRTEALRPNVILRTEALRRPKDLAMPTGILRWPTKACAAPDDNRECLSSGMPEAPRPNVILRTEALRPNVILRTEALRRPKDLAMPTGILRWPTKAWAAQGDK